jgi:8-oxo-dGTP pyrophosphatase MutT (NUDIX family)
LSTALTRSRCAARQSWEACAARELSEETGIVLSVPPVFAAVGNNVLSDTACGFCALLFALLSFVDACVR